MFVANKGFFIVMLSLNFKMKLFKTAYVLNLFMAVISSNRILENEVIYQTNKAEKVFTCLSNGMQHKRCLHK